jgi:hypothetical protein
MAWKSQDAMEAMHEGGGGNGGIAGLPGSNAESWFCANYGNDLTREPRLAFGRSSNGNISIEAGNGNNGYFVTNSWATGSGPMIDDRGNIIDPGKMTTHVIILWVSGDGYQFGGNWGNGISGGGQIPEVPGLHVSFDIDKAANNINSHAGQKYSGHCGRNVRWALEAGFGLKENALFGIAPGSAKYYEGFLPDLGFTNVSWENYQPIKGDIVVFQTCPGHPGGSDHNDGHIQMYDGTRWVSDRVQPSTEYSRTGFYCSPDFVNHQTDYSIFRWR